MKPHADQRMRGMALPVVLLIGLFTMLLGAASLIGGETAERQAVDQSLADLRAHWAARGHVNFALSRLRRFGNCNTFFGGCTQDSTTEKTIAAYMEELVPRQRFRYPEEAAEYYIDVSATALADDIPNRHSKSGHMRMIVSFPSSDLSPIAVLNRLVPSLQNIVTRICITNTATASCPDPTGAGQHSESTGFHRITNYRWMGS